MISQRAATAASVRGIQGKPIPSPIQRARWTHAAVTVTVLVVTQTPLVSLAGGLQPASWVTVGVGTGANVAICGIAVQGDKPRQFLIRGIGPALTGFGVNGALVDPLLTLTSATGATVATNDDWESAGNAADLIASAAKAGAFTLPRGSKDSAVLISLAPGNYTGLISGANGTTGIALLEVYEVP